MPFIEPMLATLADYPPAGDAWIHELKYDGYRTQLTFDGHDWRGYTRRGHDWSNLYRSILKAAAALSCKSAIIDGEVIIQDSTGLPNYERLRRELASRKPSDLIFIAFDLLHLNGTDLLKEPVEDRRKRLRELLFAGESAIHFSDSVTGDGQRFFEAAEQVGAEGIVSKKLGSRYRSGRSRSWVKVKALTESEFIVIGATPGDLAPRALLARETEDAGLEYVGPAMVTLADPDRERFWRATEKLEISGPALPMDRVKETTWVKPEMRVRVQHLRGEEPLRHAVLKAITYLPAGI